jgi:chromosomal replication initiation ATPase DnaA
MTQLAIDLPYLPALGRADFLVSGCNADAVARIECWPDWPGRVLVLHGPPRSGKTHLARLWCGHSGAALVRGAALRDEAPPALAAAGGAAVDDAEEAPEEALLHLHNCCVEAGAALLVLARAAPAQWPFGLPDLASRLRAAPAAAIGPPDDALLAARLVKHFADRGMRVAPGVIRFAVRRMERSFAAAAALAALLDRMALGAGGPVGIALVRRALAGLAAPGEPAQFSP